ncbi:g13143 [Coccomyxa viridis]|uniref:G13143 protein n=1 Tax=Coccomyxa viridis TaxID=1274662 RepID=A0ABP1GC19_9CHLO
MDGKRGRVRDPDYYEGDDYNDVTYVPQRTSSRRRATAVDFNKWGTASLRRYNAVHKLLDMHSGTREELITAIQRHWALQVVDEEATIQALVNMARRKHIEREANLGVGGAIKKPRYIGNKPGPKAMR